ncbi:MAG: glycoside hydrolase family 3 N-terminal domain-containing protein, partial [Steroidobacteraceae bacterium]
MYSIFAATLVVVLAFTGASARAAQPATQAASAATAPADDPRDLALLQRMTLQEKVNQLIMFGHGSATGPDNAGRPTNKTLDEFVREGIGSVMSSAPTGHAKFANRLQRIAVTESRLGIPIVFATDIIHGFWTTFPVPLGMAATWDPDDARTMGRISGLEGYAGGERWTFAPMLDHPADPRWGRVVETFGEAPLLASDYGVGVIQGFHGALKDQPGVTAPYELGVATCAKHFLGYGAVQGGKDYAYVDLSERTWREFHLPTFAAAIKAGVPTIMPAFTTGPGGVPMTANKRVLQDLARDELGFRGVYVSDYAAITELRYHGVAADNLEAAVKALRDGSLSVDMEDGVYWAQLKRAVESGRLPVDLVDREVLRVLAFKRRLGFFENPYFPENLEARVRLAPAHRAAALAIARKSIVLLKNDADLLPLEGKRRILVTGPLADSREDLLGAWAGLGEPGAVIGVLQGIREKAAERGRAQGTIDVVYSEGGRIDEDGKSQSGDEERIARAVALARDRDVIIAVVGERASMTGEARNRTRLDLPGLQQQLVDALAATGKPVVVVLLTGRPLAVPELVDRSHALVHAFFPGIEGGHAIADILFGDYNPGGKEPITWPRSVGQLPIHHYDRPNGRPNLPERGEYGARWMDEVDGPLFPFGYGLSYSRFALDALEVPQSVRVGDDVVIRVRVANAGQRDGDETPQLYVRPRVASTVNGLRLQGYRRVHVEAGQSRVVEFRVPSSRLAIYDPLDQLRVEPGVYEVRVGLDAASGIAGSFRLCERSAAACSPVDARP